MSGIRCATAVLLLCGLTFAQAVWKLPQRNSAPRNDSKTLLTRYCQMDGVGMRLNSQRAKSMQELTTWQTLPSVEAFDVISGIEMETPKVGGDEARITVSYKVLGTYHKGAAYEPEARIDTVEYRLIQQDGEWKISASDEMARPRLFRAHAYRWFREQIAVAKDADAKALLEDAARQTQP